MAPPGCKPQIYDNKPVCAGAWARTVKDRRSASVFKRQNRQFLIGGVGGEIAIIF